MVSWKWITYTTMILYHSICRDSKTADRHSYTFGLTYSRASVNDLNQSRLSVLRLRVNLLSW